MTRLSYVDAANLSPDQKALYNSIASGPRAAKRASLVDADGQKPIDLVGADGRSGGTPAPSAATVSATPGAGAAGRGGRGPGLAAAAEIRALLQNAFEGRRP